MPPQIYGLRTAALKLSTWNGQFLLHTISGHCIIEHVNYYKIINWVPLSYILQASQLELFPPPRDKVKQIALSHVQMCLQIVLQTNDAGCNLEWTIIVYNCQIVPFFFNMDGCWETSTDFGRWFRVIDLFDIHLHDWTQKKPIMNSIGCESLSMEFTAIL